MGECTGESMNDFDETWFVWVEVRGGAAVGVVVVVVAVVVGAIAIIVLVAVWTRIVTVAGVVLVAVGSSGRGRGAIRSGGGESLTFIGVFVEEIFLCCLLACLWKNDPVEGRFCIESFTAESIDVALDAIDVCIDAVAKLGD